MIDFTPITDAEFTAYMRSRGYYFELNLTNMAKKKDVDKLARRLAINYQQTLFKMNKGYCYFSDFSNQMQNELTEAMKPIAKRILKLQKLNT